MVDTPDAIRESVHTLQVKQTVRLIERSKQVDDNPELKKIRTEDPNVDWFTEALRRKMLRSIASWDPDNASAAEHYRELVMKADTVGQLIDVLYYDWSLHNDVSQLVDTMNEACNERDLGDPQLIKVIKQWVEDIDPQMVTDYPADDLRGLADCYDVIGGTADSDTKYEAAVYVRRYRRAEVISTKEEYGTIAPSKEDYDYLHALEDDVAFLDAWIGRYDNPKG